MKHYWLLLGDKTNESQITIKTTQRFKSQASGGLLEMKHESPTKREISKKYKKALIVVILVANVIPSLVMQITPSQRFYLRTIISVY